MLLGREKKEGSSRELNTYGIKEIVAEHLPGRRSFPLLGFLFIMVAGYVLFFTSKLWFPAHGELIEPTPLYQRVSYEHYELYLTEWTYSKPDQAMQIILEFDNKEILDTKFQYEAVERAAGEMKVRPVLETHDYVMLRIEGVPDNWKELSLRIGKANSDSPAKLYTNIDSVKRTPELPEKTAREYQVERLEAQLTYDQAQQKVCQEKLEAFETEKLKLEEKIQELESGSYLSEDEVKQAEETIGKAKSQIQLNADNTQCVREELEALEKRSETIQEQMVQLEQEE